MKCILFDLDGTILDTANDLLYSINCVREIYNLPQLELEQIRHLLNLGSSAIIKNTFDGELNDKLMQEIKQHFFDFYLKNLARSTNFFPNVEKVLDYLDDKKIPWGIVTNKLSIHTDPLLLALKFHERPGCIVSGDTLATSKPHPAPILHACHALKATPSETLYVGDAITDVLAGKAAGTKTMVALYGYMTKSDPYAWDADKYINNPIELIDWIEDQQSG